jgi:hypothetical protein
MILSIRSTLPLGNVSTLCPERPMAGSYFGNLNVARARWSMQLALLAARRIDA